MDYFNHYLEWIAGVLDCNETSNNWLMVVQWWEVGTSWLSRWSLVRAVLTVLNFGLPGWNNEQWWKVRTDQGGEVPPARQVQSRTPTICLFPLILMGDPSLSVSLRLFHAISRAFSEFPLSWLLEIYSLPKLNTLFRVISCLMFKMVGNSY